MRRFGIGGNGLRDIFILVLGAVFFRAEYLLFARIFNGDAEVFWDLLIYHFFFLLLVLFIGCVWFLFFKSDRRNFLFFSLFFIPLGFFGVAGYALFYVLHKINTCVGKTNEEYYEEFFGKDGGSSRFIFHDNIVSGKMISPPMKDITAFRDILSCGSLADRQKVVMAIVSDFSPAFSPILLDAAHDKHSQIKAMAMAAVSAIKNRYLQRSIVLFHRMEERKGDPVAISEYAEFMDNYAYMGLLDKNSEREALVKAVDAYISLYNAGYDKLSVIYRIVRGYIRLSRYTDAYDWIQKYRSSGMEDSSALEDWNIECLFELRMFNVLKEKAAERLDKIKNSGDIDRYPKDYIQALALWKGAVGND